MTGGPEEMMSGIEFINKSRPTDEPRREREAESGEDSPTAPEAATEEQPIALSPSDGEAEGKTPPLTATEFLSARHRQARSRDAQWGWRRTIRHASLGLIHPAMGATERQHHDNLDAVQRTFRGPKTVVIANHKGGAVKTPTTILLSATLGMARGGGVLAWDNNELEGTLGLRTVPAQHTNTICELLADVERLSASPETRLGDLYAYVRGQGPAHFDVLASATFGQMQGLISRGNFEAAHDLMSRFYPVMVIDTGNNPGSANWRAAMDQADLLVVPTSVQADRGAMGLSMLDQLEAEGYGQLARSAVTVISKHEPSPDPSILNWLDESFRHRTSGVVTVPYDPALSAGDHLDYERLSFASREAWLSVAAHVAQSL